MNCLNMSFSGLNEMMIKGVLLEPQETREGQL